MYALKIRNLLMLGLVAVALPLFAHHGTAGSYDMEKVVTVKGTVKEFRWRNPHSALFVVSKDAAGKEVVYAFEMGSPNTLARAGYTRDTIKAGDAISVDMYPSFTHPTNGYSPTNLQIEVNGTRLKKSGRPE